jgi:hypothetical protein
VGSNQRMEIYQQLGIAEIWRYSVNQGLRIFHLQGQSYQEFPTSRAFPILTVVKINQVLSDRSCKGENSVIYDLRQWIRSESGNSLV